MTTAEPPVFQDGEHRLEMTPLKWRLIREALARDLREANADAAGEVYEKAARVADVPFRYWSQTYDADGMVTHAWYLLDLWHIPCADAVARVLSGRRRWQAIREVMDAQ